MKIGFWGDIITIAGLIFVAISLIIIIWGKKVGERGSGQQKIVVGKYVEVNTNSALTLLLITACIALAPFIIALISGGSNYVDKNKISEEYLPIKDLNIVVNGIITLESGESAVDVPISIYEGSKDITNITDKAEGYFKTGQMGNFNIRLLNVKPKKEYKITFQTTGTEYEPVELAFGLDHIAYNVRLNKRGGN